MRYREELTDDERAVLLGLAEGLSVAAIATEHGRSTGKTTSIQDVLFTKLDARNAAHAVALGYHRGILVPAVRA